jgi:colanic acid/amylovoran biosynthesis glycosyltransferase
VRIAYLINQYPKVSHSFIRREIQALERQGVVVSRIAIRGWDLDLVDAEDKSERERTRYVLRDGKLPLIMAILQILLTHPLNFFRGLILAWQTSRSSERSLPIHLIYLAEACRVRIWLSESPVEHVHAHFGTNSADVAMQVHVLGGPKWSFTVHGPEEFDKPHAIGLSEKIKASAFVVAISSYGRSQLYRLVDHRLWDKIFIVRCGLDRPFYDEEPPPLYPSNKFVCVGRLCEQKGQMLLLSAIDRLRDLKIPVDLVLAGDGEMRPDIERFITDHNLQSTVRVTGWIGGDQVRKEILAARTMVLPSFAEGLPVVLMEALALRRPVISTYVAGIPELVQAGTNGWLVPAGDVDALVSAIRDCISASDEKLHRMGDSGRQRVLEDHDIDRQASKLARFFSSAGLPHDDGPVLHLKGTTPPSEIFP